MKTMNNQDQGYEQLQDQILDPIVEDLYEELMKIPLYDYKKRKAAIRKTLQRVKNMSTPMV